MLPFMLAQKGGKCFPFFCFFQLSLGRQSISKHYFFEGFALLLCTCLNSHFNFQGVKLQPTNIYWGLSPKHFYWSETPRSKFEHKHGHHDLVVMSFSHVNQYVSHYFMSCQYVMSVCQVSMSVSQQSVFHVMSVRHATLSGQSVGQLIGHVSQSDQYGSQSVVKTSCHVNMSIQQYCVPRIDHFGHSPPLLPWRACLFSVQQYGVPRSDDSATIFRYFHGAPVCLVFSSTAFRELTISATVLATSMARLSFYYSVVLLSAN